MKHYFLFLSLLSEISAAFHSGFGCMPRGSAFLLDAAKGDVIVSERLLASDETAPERARWSGSRVEARIKAQVQKKEERMRSAAAEATRLAREIHVTNDVRESILEEAMNRAADAQRARWVGDRVRARIEAQAKRERSNGNAEGSAQTAQAEVAARLADAESAHWASERVAARLQAQLQKRKEAEQRAREESLRAAFETRVLLDSLARTDAEVSAKSSSAERANWAAKMVEARLRK